MAMRVTRAGVGLIIGIIVLAGLVWGGLYLVKQRGEVARRNETLKIAEQKLNDESNKDVAIDQGNKNSNDTAKNDEEKSNNSTSSNNQGGSNGSSSNSSNLPATGPSQSVTELPQTGVTDILAIVPIAAITFAVGSYIASRKALR